MHSPRRLLVVLMLLIGTMLFTQLPYAVQAKDAPSQAESGKKVKKVVPLKPSDAKSKKDGLNFSVIWYTDETYTVEGSYTPADGETANMNIDYTVDVEKETFSADIQPYDKSKHPVPQLEFDAASKVTTMASIRRETRRRLIVTAKDLPGIPLTAIEVLLSWREWTDGFRDSWHNLGCTEYTQTWFGTRWYRASCSRSDYLAPTKTYASTTGVGKFYNYDYGDVSKRTDITLTGYIRGNFDASFSMTYNWTCTPTGEGYSLIHGSAAIYQDY